MSIYLTKKEILLIKSNLSEIELAWAAGFFDGEGHVSLRLDYKSKLSSHMWLNVSQSSNDNKVPETLIRFQKAVGGFGKIGKPNIRPTRKPLYALQISNECGVCFVLSVLWPYLGSVKKEQAIKANYLVNRYRFNLEEETAVAAE